MIARPQFELAVDNNLIVGSKTGIDESLAAADLSHFDSLSFRSSQVL